MCKTYGYCRISRRTQNIERQVRNIKSVYPTAIIIEEAYTGTKIKGREKFERLCKTVKAGDTIVFDSVSRMSRNAEEGVAQYKEWFNAGVNLIFLKERYIDTSIYASKLKQADVSTGKKYLDEGLKVILLGLAEEQIRIAFEQAEKEVDDLHYRTSEGIATARLNGKQIGQQPGRKLNVKKAAAAKEIIRKHSKDFAGTLDDTDVIKLAGISRNSFYKYKKELRAE